MNAKGTYIYLYLSKLVIVTYIKADTDILVRLYYGWIVTFSYRMWLSSLQLKKNYSQQEKDNCFITKAAWLSVEINIHCLTALIILVSQGNLPSYSLNTYLFSSQRCETTFHSARALSENNLNHITKLNSFVFHQLDLKSTVDFCYFNEVELQDSLDDTNNIQSDIENSETNLEVDCYDSDEDNSDDYHFTTSKEAFQGMKIFDKIDPSKQDNYFRIMINNKSKYLHKQTAARLLTTNKNCLSSDRLSRVQQTNKQK
ncbi:unnamed protein product [Rotaria sp. Silwood1]|nr:unnamed protein product [Rotaria sp. Silwood1]